MLIPWGAEGLDRVPQGCTEWIPRGTYLAVGGDVVVQLHRPCGVAQRIVAADWRASVLVVVRQDASTGGVALNIL